MLSKKHILQMVIIFLLLAGCGGKKKPTTTASVPTIPPATATLALTHTPVPTPTATPTSTPLPPQGIVQQVKNEVDAHPLAEQDWKAALVDMLLYSGGEVWAKESSTALVKLVSEGNLVRVAPNTVFTLSRPDAGTLQLNLQEGQVWINIEGLEPGEQFQVETPAAVASIRGTRFSVSVGPDETTVVSCVDGFVSITSTVGTTVTVKYKMQTTIRPGEDPQPPGYITDTESIRWGMAAGSHLDVVTPVGDLFATYTVSGTTSSASWSGDSSMLAFYYYDPASDDYSSEMMFYHLPSAAPITLTGIPTDTYEIVFNPAGEGVAWHQNVDGQSSICSSSKNDGSLAVCFPPPATGYFPGSTLWSPDGQWLLNAIAVLDKSALPEIVHVTNLYRSRPDGSEMMQLTSSTITDTQYYGHYTWSPDGIQIAYSYAITDDWETPGPVVVMNADGSDPKVIFKDLDNPRYAELLAWSPDGKWLALPNFQGLFLVSPDGSTVRQIPGTEPGHYPYVKWSPTPTGWPLLYRYYDEVNKTGGDYYVLDENASPEGFLSASSWGPVYSPDGKWVAFGLNQRIREDPEAYQSRIYFFQVLPLWP
jgi:hypothetical protein